MADTLGNNLGNSMLVTSVGLIGTYACTALVLVVWTCILCISDSRSVDPQRGNYYVPKYLRAVPK